jgi:hypothetical protein
MMFAFQEMKKPLEAAIDFCEAFGLRFSGQAARQCCGDAGVTASLTTSPRLTGSLSGGGSGFDAALW